MSLSTSDLTVVIIYAIGLFWKRASEAGAIAAAVASVVLSYHRMQHRFLRGRCDPQRALRNLVAN